LAVPVAVLDACILFQGRLASLGDAQRSTNRVTDGVSSPYRPCKIPDRYTPLDRLVRRSFTVC